MFPEISNYIVSERAPGVSAESKKPLTTQAVAEQFGYTREYFCRIFKEYSNLTFKNYLTSLRLSAAVQEIVMSDRGIGQIAMEYGFSDEKSFFGAFKKKYGMTPAQYRQTMGKQ